MIEEQRIQFEKDKSRGKVGEGIISSFHSRINYGKPLPKYKSFVTDEGSLTENESNAPWKSIDGYNSNRDFVAYEKQGNTVKEIRHEIKTDYGCYVGKSFPTGNIFVEVDAAAIANRNYVTSSTGVKSFRGYYNPNATDKGRNADFYHFLLPLYDRQGTDELGARASAISSEELAIFRNDSRISEDDSILSSVPIEAGLILTNQALKILLERYCNIQWNEYPLRSNEYIGCLLPVREIIKDIDNDRILRGSACITALPETVRKDESSNTSGHLWITRTMRDSYYHEYGNVSEECKNEVSLTLGLNLGMINGVRSFSYNPNEITACVFTEEGSRSYGGTDNWRAPFPIIDELKKLKIYPPDAPIEE